ncbi:MotA/TolQ/ExbB proton channel family protein [Parasulfuritortus cantonensis]|uniref:MotA/TolQ/ExbB proton channel family protein n=1 Tax=Parasulfuritortus cantonensis TaxID=2528202 RepID=A0A4R1BN56_9PROT|nr:MotA/TolQ/ExbB proton channel family protein [Parasulfuritortus cantonensis]TCJ18934.1 MotA/TolQ/ExbB proton channel family protein [Parasulfuritortus cantonensis]
MNLVSLIEQFLFQVASALYLPVIGAVSLLVFHVALSFGGLCHEAWERRRPAPALARYRARLGEELAAAEPHLDARLERLLQGEELAATRRLDRIRFVVKVGPALGLMGTLIPMGISLAALAEGNIPKMAGSMVTAFTATVAGLGCGVAAYLIALVREKWLRADIREMEYLTEVAAREHADGQEGSCAT